MVKKITKLTQKQKDMIPIWSEKWIKIGLKTGETDWETFDKYMPICYEKAGLKYPKNIIKVNSPLVGAFWASTASSAVESAVRSAVGSAIVSAVESDVGNAVESDVGSAVESDVRSAVESAVESDVRSAVVSAVGSIVGSAVVSAVESDVYRKKLSWHHWLGGQFWVGYWWGSPSFVSFFIDICNLELSQDMLERAEAYRKICESVNYIWCNKNFVIVCARPKTINLDAEGRLHSDISKSIEYSDGWGLYHLHGVGFEEELWKNVVSKKMPFEDILKIDNIDQRTQAMKYAGIGHFLTYSKAKVLDRYSKFTPDKAEVRYWLYMIPKGDIFPKDAHYMVYEDPSTFELYMSGVPNFKSVAEAMAWKCSDEEYIMTPKEWKSMIPLVHES